MPELTTAPVETAIDTADELYFNDTSETPDALNRITFGNFRTSVLSGVIDLGGATSFELPNSATPTVDADGEIAVDTSVADFSHGIVKVFAGEELALVALPIAELTTPTDGHIIAYNATNDEFELVAPSGGGIGGSTGATDNAILRADGTGGSTVQNTGITVDDNNRVAMPGSATDGILFGSLAGTFGNLIFRSGNMFVGVENNQFFIVCDQGGNSQFRVSHNGNLDSYVNSSQTGYQQLTEMTAPSAPATNNVRIYAEDNGSGKTRLMALFPTGAAQQIAIEP